MYDGVVGHSQPPQPQLAVSRCGQKIQ